MRKLLAALLCLVLASPAYAQKTKTQLNTEINTNLPDNAVGAITPALVRTTLLDMVASWLDLNGTSAFNCGVNTFANAFSNLSTPSCAQPAFSNLAGNIAVSQMNSGTGASSTTVWKGDGTWGTVAGVGTVTEQKNTAGTGLSTSGNCDNTSTNAGSPCQYNVVFITPTTSLVTIGAHNGGFGTNGSGTYTTPAGVRWLEGKLIGGGGGGGGGNQSIVASNGTGTCWNTTGAACTSPVYQAGGGVAGIGNGGGGSGGAVSGSGVCNWSVGGGGGGGGVASTAAGGIVGVGGIGGSSFLGGGGASGYSVAGGAAAADSGGGGGGGAAASSTFPSGGGGGAGATCSFIISSPAATYTYTVGTAGAAGAGTGGSGFNGGPGAGGQIQIIEHYGF